MRSTRTALGSLLPSIAGFAAAFAAAFAAFAEELPPAQPWHERARAMLEHLVNVPTVAGRGRVPGLAKWLAGKYRAAGIPAADIHLMPYESAGEKTAALIVRWRAPGSPAAKPIMLMSHMDVIEARRDDWGATDPFVFTEKGGYYYGRGTLDIKVGIAATTTAILELKAAGFTPVRDILVFYTGDEETEGRGAQLGATEWRSLLDAEYGLNSDAGGGLFAADGRPLGFALNLAEKTYASYTFTVRNKGGHSSLPRADNAIYQLAAALRRLEAYRFEPMLIEASRAYFAGREKLEPGPLGDAMRAWLADPANGKAADLIEADESTVGYTRTRCVATRLAAGHADNALAQQAVATVNCRVMPGVSPDAIREELVKIVADPGVSVARADDYHGSPAAPLRADVLAAYTDAVRVLHPGSPVIPEMSPGASDGAFFRAAGIPVYGVEGSWAVSPEDLRMHGKDERLPVKALGDDVDHWVLMLKRLAGPAMPATASASTSANASASAPPGAPFSASAAAAAQLRSLFAASNEAYLERNPLQGILRGDPRFGARFGDLITDAYFAAERKAASDDLEALSRIDRTALAPADRTSYDVFRFQRELDLRGLEPAILAATVDRPIEHFFGAQTWMPELSSGAGAAPFRTVADYENNLLRLDGYIVFLDRAIERMRHGLATGSTNPRLVMENVVGELDALNAEGVEGSTFYKPMQSFPDAVPPADRARLKVAYAGFLRTKLIPAHTRLRDFLKDEYLPRARTSVGLAQMNGGTALYRYLVAANTTTSMTPEEIHALGLAEVGRIRGRMEEVKARIGFDGDLAAFAQFLRTDPRFAPATKDAMREAFEAIGRRVAESVSRDFSTVPRSRLEIRPVPEYREKTDAGGSYDPGTPDGLRPGIFHYNTWDLPSRYTWEFETLFLHEAVPGHHYQVSLAQEATSLPDFQRFGGNTAYVEGWALYAESLGPELGMFTDPYQLYGHLNDEMLRAMRLVVDTGLHANGWSREQAIDYMLANSALSRTDAVAEVERYIAIPGQAVAYKVGQLTIRRLRTRAEDALGARFDVRAFHDQVLLSGALPLAVLETKIDDWIASVKKAPVAP